MHAAPAPSVRRPVARALGRGLLALLCLPLGAAAQFVIGNEAFGTGVRGLTELPPRNPAAVAAPAASAPALPAVAPAPAPAQAQPLPPDPATAAKPLMFGSQIFTGRFGSETFGGFNPDYLIATGDRITLRMWGAFTYEAVAAVDAQGNVFIPNVGPVAVRGVRNADLNRRVETAVKRTFRANVGVYASLEAAQPVKVYVTGFVRAPGLYGGLSSDSVLYYLDKAGGIDPDRGSYLAVDVLRGGKPRTRINLYRFLLDGQIEALQLQDGDTLVAAPRKHTVQVGGEVLNPYIFEFAEPRVRAVDLIAMARPRPGATHLSVVRKIGAERRSEYHPLSAAAEVTLEDGDEVTFTADKYPGTILVRIDGAHLGERSVVLPYGARLKDALARLKPAPQAQVDATQLFRKSVAAKQKELIDASLRSLETYALTARSATSEEAALRTRESDLILQFVGRARSLEPRGQVVLARGGDATDTLLEDGDVLVVPERSNLVLVGGEVLFPTAVVHDPRAKPEDYVQRAGGYTQGADQARLMVLRQDGSTALADAGGLQPGDQLLVLPRIETKNIEVTRGITQILFQIAVAARALFNL
ncbi:MAG TPA: polysaccharide biosynthesis/export family protein [Methylibium sp.]|nr:polysaccharide biosynthesis/export family protein [Methylibium sp.]